MVIHSGREWLDIQRVKVTLYFHLREQIAKRLHHGLSEMILVNTLANSPAQMAHLTYDIIGFGVGVRLESLLGRWEFVLLFVQTSKYWLHFVSHIFNFLFKSKVFVILFSSQTFWWSPKYLPYLFSVSNYLLYLLFKTKYSSYFFSKVQLLH